MAPGTKTAIHATALAYGRCGLLITGAPGAGKSSLARALIAHADLAGSRAVLVADDRVALRFSNGRLIASPLPANRGRLEVRGLGLIPLQTQGAAVMTHAILMDPAPPRLPNEGERDVDHLGVRLPAIHIRTNDPNAVSAVLARLAR